MSNHIYTRFITEKSYLNKRVFHKCLNPKCLNITANPKYCGLSCGSIHFGIKQRLKLEQKQKELELQYNFNPKKCFNPNCINVLSYDKRNNKFCSPSCSTTFYGPSKGPRTEEFKKALSIKISGSHPKKSQKQIDRESKYALSPNHCSICNTEFSYKSRNRKACLGPCTSTFISNQAKNNPNFGGFKCASQLSKNTSIFCGYKMDSGAELYFAKMCNEQGITWIKNDIHWSKGYIYKKENNKFYKYYPDFYLPQYNMWVEIKGKRYIRPDDSIRYEAIKDSQFKLVMSTDIKQFFSLL